MRFGISKMRLRVLKDRRKCVRYTVCIQPSVNCTMNLHKNYARRKQAFHDCELYCRAERARAQRPFALCASTSSLYAPLIKFSLLSLPFFALFTPSLLPSTNCLPKSHIRPRCDESLIMDLASVYRSLRPAKNTLLCSNAGPLLYIYIAGPIFRSQAKRYHLSIVWLRQRKNKKQ